LLIEDISELMNEKIRKIDGYKDYISDEDLANVFNMYTDPTLGEPYKVYNMNKTLVLKGLEDIPINSYSFYEVQQGDTWNLISYKVYGTINLYWIILKTNNVTNATIEPEPGWMLRVLPKSTISSILVNMKNN
jgi:nucleoid-associated protein YgaU